MEAIIDNEEINVYPQSKEELQDLQGPWTFVTYADFDGKKIPMHIKSSKEGEFGDDILRVRYHGKNLLEADLINIEAKKSRLISLSLLGGHDNISSSQVCCYQRLVMWSPYSDKNPFK